MFAVLDTLDERVVGDVRVARGQKAGVFSPSAIDSVIALLGRADARSSDGMSVSQRASAFLISLLATPKRGLCAPDRAASKPLQRALQRFSGVAEDPAQQRVVLAMLAAAPSLVPLYVFVFFHMLSVC